MTEPQASETASAYRPDLDGLRAVAVLAVVVYHAFPGLLPGGFVGVDVFFVISGYLITAQLRARPERLGQFYARRIRRIFPALIVVLAACLGLGWRWLFSVEFAQLGKHAAAGAAFVANIAAQIEAGYFDADKYSKPLLHLWSLGVEEQFYLVWPFVLAIVVRGRRPVAALVCLTLVGAAASVVAQPVAPIAAFFSPLFRVWELASGALLAFLAPRVSASPQGRYDLLSAGGLLAIGVAAYATPPATFPGWWASVPVVGTALVVAAGPHTRVNRSVLALPPLVWIGLISYPLYLWHWPGLVFARLFDGPLPSRATRAWVIVGSVALAWLTYRLVERPLRQRLAAAVALPLVLAMALVGGVGAWVFTSAGVPWRAAASAAQPYIDTMARAQRSVDCLDRSASAAGEGCRAGSASGATVVLSGDSHAAALLPAFDAAADAQGVQLRAVATSGCPPLLGVVVAREAAIGLTRCRDVNERVFALVRETGARQVFLAARWTYYTTVDDSTRVDIATSTGPASAEHSRAAFEAGLAETVRRYRTLGARVTFVQQVPEQPATPTMLVRHLLRARGDAEDTIARVSATTTAHHRHVEWTAAAFAVVIAKSGDAARLLDLTPAYCDGEVCPFAAPGVSYYFDANHLSAAGALRAVPVVTREMP